MPTGAPTFQASRPAPGLPLRPPGPASGRQIVGLLWAGARWPERPAEKMQNAWPELRRVVWRTCCADPRIGPNFVLLHSAKEVLAADVLDLQRVDPAMFELLMEQPVWQGLLAKHGAPGAGHSTAHGVLAGVGRICLYALLLVGGCALSAGWRCRRKLRSAARARASPHSYCSCCSHGGWLALARSGRQAG